jgi:flavin reductase ActVB
MRDLVKAIMSQDRQLFLDALASFPSGVTIVTTVDENDRWWGFTATSFCSVSVTPPLVLVCLARTAECHAAFKTAKAWMIHVIQPSHADLATLFATRGADKFASHRFRAGEDRLPVLDEVAVRLHCSTHTQYPGGDHTILVGQVESAWVDDVQAPALYYRRGFHQFPAADETGGLSPGAVDYEPVTADIPQGSWPTSVNASMSRISSRRPV